MPPAGADVAGPSWLGGALAALMIVIAVCCAGRLAAARLWHRTTEVDADGLHVVMGVAMAGMLVPRLGPLPAGAWTAVFAAAAAWFAWQAARAGGSMTGGGRRCAYPVPHLVECAAMLYMLLAVPGARPQGLATAMPGMTRTAGAGSSFPALAMVLALYLLGYVLWTADRLAALTRASTAGGARSAARPPAPVPVTSGAAGLPDDGEPPGPRPGAGTRDEPSAGRPRLAPRLAAGYKIVMGISMGYMLIMMV